MTAKDQARSRIAPPPSCAGPGDRIHAHPETAWQEHRAVGWLTDALDRLGYAVTRGACSSPPRSPPASAPANCTSGSAPNTTRYPGSATPAATTSSPPPPSAPPPAWPALPTSWGSPSVSALPPRKAAAGRSAARPRRLRRAARRDDDPPRPRRRRPGRALRRVASRTSATAARPRTRPPTPNWASTPPTRSPLPRSRSDCSASSCPPIGAGARHRHPRRGRTQRHPRPCRGPLVRSRRLTGRTRRDRTAASRACFQAGALATGASWTIKPGKPALRAVVHNDEQLLDLFLANRAISAAHSPAPAPACG